MAKTIFTVLLHQNLYTVYLSKSLFPSYIQLYAPVSRFLLFEPIIFPVSFNTLFTSFFVIGVECYMLGLMLI